MHKIIVAVILIILLTQNTQATQEVTVPVTISGGISLQPTGIATPTNVDQEEDVVLAGTACVYTNDVSNDPKVQFAAQLDAAPTFTGTTYSDTISYTLTLTSNTTGGGGSAIAGAASDTVVSDVVLNNSTASTVELSTIPNTVDCDGESDPNVGLLLTIAGGDLTGKAADTYTSSIGITLTEVA